MYVYTYYLASLSEMVVKERVSCGWVGGDSFFVEAAVPTATDNSQRFSGVP